MDRVALSCKVTASLEMKPKYPWTSPSANGAGSNWMGTTVMEE